MFTYYKRKTFIFCTLKDLCSRSRSRSKKAAPALGSDLPKNRFQLWSRLKTGGSGSATLLHSRCVRVSVLVQTSSYLHYNVKQTTDKYTSACSMPIATNGLQKVNYKTEDESALLIYCIYY